MGEPKLDPADLTPLQDDLAALQDLAAPTPVVEQHAFTSRLNDRVADWWTPWWVRTMRGVEPVEDECP